ncbi:MAG TPA: DISARM system phospholipase D-like protein DrmC [Solirubrobacterales bacterium]|nr:DISARM system phospholipase D-like protein DrmC [Solirubrobacterales bacterium]
MEAFIGDVLARLSDAQVEALAAACRGRARPPGNLTRVVVGGSPAAHQSVERLATSWASEPLLTGDGIALALGVGLAARREADSQRSRAVWTGPGATGEERLTAAVLHELIVAARQRVLLVSFAAYTLAEVAADLEAAVGRGCTVAAVFETEEDSAGAYAGPASHPFQGIDGIRRWRWPAANREQGAVLHAKLLVVDGKRALVGSANLTHRALSANLEVGVLVRDPALAGRLEDHVHGLMSSGVLVGADS